MTNLEDIQKNTSEFNIRFHFKEVVGLAMMQVFGFESNRSKIEELMKLKVEPCELKNTIIGSAFDDLIKCYLENAFDEEA